MRKLLLRGRPGVLVPNPFVIGANPPRFVGKAPIEDPPEDLQHTQRFRDVEEALPDHAYLRMAVREESLVAADEATARLCGVPWQKRSAP